MSLQGELTVFDTTDCVTFDAVSDTSYETGPIVENLLRQLNYEGLVGVAEFVSWLVKSAGCDIRFELAEQPSKARMSTMASKIDSACIDSVHPGSFPIQSPSYVKRVTSLLGAVTKSLKEAENDEAVSYLSELVAGLMMAHLQSLRLTATVFAGIMTRVLDEQESVLIKGLKSRCADVSIVIRKKAVLSLGPHGTDAIMRSLNDENASVRVSALKALPEINSWDRLVEMSTQDSDQAVRRAALRVLLSVKDELNLSEEQWGTVGRMRFDEDSLSRKLACELLVYREYLETQSPQRLIVKVANFVTEEPLSAQALAHGLEKLDGEWPQEIVSLLTTDMSKEARKNVRRSAAKTREIRELATEMTDEGVKVRLLYLLRALLQSEARGSRKLAKDMPRLLTRMQISTELLASSLMVVSCLPFDFIIAGNSDDEQSVTELANATREIFQARDEPELLEAASNIFAHLPESIRIPICSDMYQDYRIELASLLGPRGQKVFTESSKIGEIAAKLSILARFVDASGVIKLPLWQALDLPPVLQLVRTVAMASDVNTMRTVAQKLAKCTPPAVDDVLRIFVAARMRNIDIEIPLPVDINESEPSSESVWRAAVAAGVI